MDGRSEVLTACNIKAGLDSNGSIQGQQQALLITVMNIRTPYKMGNFLITEKLAFAQ
jgi:hypothetical protein